MRPTLRQLQYFVAVADTGRFGDAARLMNVSQPSLSAQLADMEQALGVTLFERGPRGALPTPDGNRLLERARTLLRDMDAFKEMARSGGDLFAGRMNLGVLPSIGPYLVPRTTRALHAAYPDLRLGIREARTVDLERMMISGELDVLISTPEDHPDKDFRPLFSEGFWICVASDDPLAGETGPVLPEALSGRELLNLGPGHRFSMLIQTIADVSGAYISTEYEGTSLDAIRQMAEMGTGVAILPSLYVATEARRDAGLILRPIKMAEARRDIALIWRRTSPYSEAFDALAGVFRDAARDVLTGSGSPG